MYVFSNLYESGRLYVGLSAGLFNDALSYIAWVEHPEAGYARWKVNVGVK
ncbi:MAG TPA: hypothetical protein VGE45_12970 [Chloroflexia bacterium]|jgi:hypothetical protein